MSADKARLFEGDSPTTHNAEDIPNWYAERLAKKDAPIASRGAFLDTVKELRRAATRPAAYTDAETGNKEDAPGFYAIVDPAREGTAEEAVWTFTTTNYDVANPIEIYGPLAEAARSHGVAGEMFGAVREYQRGGEVHMEVFFPEFEMDFPTKANREPFVMGVRTGYDYFSGRRIYSEIIAGNPASGTVLRGFSDQHKRSHRKSKNAEDGQTADEVAAWWSAELDRMDAASDALLEAVMAASEHEVDFSDYPAGVGPREAFEKMGLPTRGSEENPSLVDMACTYLPNDGPEATLTAWEVYESISLALSNDYGVKEDGSAMLRHIKTANEWFQHPQRAEQKLVKSFVEEYREDTETDANQSTLMHPGMDPEERERVESLKNLSKSLGEKMESRKSLTQMLKERMKAAQETADTETEADADGEADTAADGDETDDEDDDTGGGSGRGELARAVTDGGRQSAEDDPEQATLGGSGWN